MTAEHGSQAQPWPEDSQPESIERFVHDGVTLAYTDTGQGEPVVFLHGVGLTHRMWDPQVSHLSARYRCIAVDFRGHGASSGKEGEAIYSISALAEDVRALLDHLGLARAHLVGLSLGALVAEQFVIDYPDRVSSVVTMGAAYDAAPNFALKVFGNLLTARIYRKLAKGGGEYLGTMAQRWTKDAAVKKYLYEDGRTMNPDEFHRLWDGVMLFRVGDRLPTVQTPFLVLAGARDFNLRQARQSAKLIPGARFELIPDAGHIVNRDQPDLVNKQLDGWLHAVVPAQQDPRLGA